MRIISVIFILSILVSCGATKNSDREKGGGGKPNNDTRDNRAATPGEFQATIRTHTYRNTGTIQLSIKEEALAVIAGKLPATYAPIPQFNLHNDAKVIKLNPLPSINTSCGNDIEATTTIKARVADCKTKQADTMAITWLGKAYGISGEGNWQLISNSVETIEEKKNAYQLWHDESTDLIWSDIVTEADFFIATGSKDGSIDNKDDRVCQANIKSYPLGRINPLRISWKIPNRNDFLQADLNGARYVLPNTDDLVWTGSYNKDNEAWAIKQSTGELISTPVTEKLKVRCIGIILE